MSKLGINAKIYFNAGGGWDPGGTVGTPGTSDPSKWKVISGVSDMNRAGTWNKATYTTRRSRVEVARKTTLGLTITGKLLVDPDDDGYKIMYAAFLAEQPLDLMILQGRLDTPGITGFRCEWYVDGATEDQGLQVVLFEDFTLSPSDENDHHPQSVLIADGPVIQLVDLVPDAAS